MKIVIAMDSFKGSMTTHEAGNAVADGIKRVFPKAEIEVAPLADGGEGSSQIIIQSNRGTVRKVRVRNPLGEAIEAQYGVLPDQTAVIEMAAAAGITLIPDESKNPMHTTTYGVGEMIKDAILSGCRNFIIGIGGSATNDGGAGMLTALGFEFADERGNPVECGAKGLAQIKQIKTDKVLRELSACRFTVACDVQNPLCGENGCSAVYGPQKGASPEMVAEMDRAMRHFETVSKEINPNADGSIPGSGAAGGSGFAFLTYLNSTLQSGIELLISKTGLREKIQSADIVITGEGRLDKQSCMGKAVSGVAAAAKASGKCVLVFAGSLGDDAKAANQFGIDAFFSAVKKPCSLDEAMRSGIENLSDTAEQVFRAIKCTNRIDLSD